MNQITTKEFVKGFDLITNPQIIRISVIKKKHVEQMEKLEEVVTGLRWIGRTEAYAIAQEPTENMGLVRVHNLRYLTYFRHVKETDLLIGRVWRDITQEERETISEASQAFSWNTWEALPQLFVD